MSKAIKTVCAAVPLLIFASILSGCNERYEIVVVGKVMDARGRLIQNGSGKLCVNLYKATATPEDGRSRCQQVSLGTAQARQEKASFVGVMSGSIQEFPLRYTTSLTLDGYEFGGNLVWQEGIQYGDDKVYRGKALIEFYPR